MTTTASGIVGSAQSYAKSWVQSADSLMTTFDKLAQAKIVVEPPDLDFGALSDAPLDYLNQVVKAPRLANSILPVPLSIAGDFPAPPDFSGIEPVAMPSFSASLPAVEIPDAPTVTLPAAPGAAPTFTLPDMPDAPAVAFPALPELAAIALPAVPSVDLPTFADTAPTYDLDPPSSTFAFAEAEYQSALLDGVKAKLLEDLSHGGYGIEPADETALWSRAREREAMAGNQMAQEVARDFASRGFMVPPGAMFSAMEAARAKLQQAANTLSREIALKRADLYVQNRQFTIQQVRETEQMLIGFHAAQMERFLNVAKATAEFALSFYNARVAGFNARLDAHKTAAAVFETRLRAAVEVINVYKAQIEAARVASDMNRAQVDTFRARVEGVQSVVNVYRTQMEAVQTQANIERTRLDAYKAAVDAYVATVQAKSAEFGLFEARIKGEMSKVQIFETQVRAFNAQVDGAKVQSEVVNLKFQQELEKARLALTRRSQAIEDAKARSDLALANQKMTLNHFEVDSANFKADAQIGIERARAAMQLQESAYRAKEIEARADLESARLTLESIKAQFQTQLGAADAGSRVYAQMVSGALSSVNTLVSMSDV